MLLQEIAKPKLRADLVECFSWVGGKMMLWEGEITFGEGGGGEKSIPSTQRH